MKTDDAAASYGRMTVRELCVGDVITCDTHESGQMTGIVRSIKISATSSAVSIDTVTGSSRTLLVGNDDAGFSFAARPAAWMMRAMEAGR